MSNNLQKIYTDMIGNRKHEIEWYGWYTSFTKDVRNIKDALKRGRTLDNKECYKKTNFKDEEDPKRSFLEKLFYEQANGVASKGKSTISYDNFEVLIEDDEFLKIVSQLIKSPTFENHNALRIEWNKKVKRNNRVIINRATATCTTKVSTTVDESKFDQVFNWLQKEKYIPEYKGKKEEGDWYLKNIFVIREVGKVIDEKDPHWISIFIWTMWGDLDNLSQSVGSEAKQKKGNTQKSSSPSKPTHSLILYGPPGTGKTFSLKKRAVEIVTQSDKSLSQDKINSAYKNYLDNKQIVFTTFHQSMSYETFIEGLTASTDDDGNIKYEVKKGIFRRICDKAEEAPEKNHVLIIDEINRGNISSVFGELITLIEPDKRKGAENEISLTLPYSKNLFSVPNNLYILGTMNTADRSIEALDTALRRRFTFEEMMPEYDDDLLSTNCEGINLQTMLRFINNALCLLLDREKQIGHAYFLDIKTKDKLKTCFKLKIIPLLQEYFYGDYEKIQKILGKTFVKTVDDEDALQISSGLKDISNDNHIYEFTNPSKWNFQDIYKKDNS